MRVAPDRNGDIALDPVDRRIVAATQAGLPLTARPYHAVAQDLGLPAAEVMRRITRMLETGAIRRIGAVPNHYALGYLANVGVHRDSMCFDIDNKAPTEIDFLGAKIVEYGRRRGWSVGHP